MEILFTIDESSLAFLNTRPAGEWNEADIRRLVYGAIELVDGGSRIAGETSLIEWLTDFAWITVVSDDAATNREVLVADTEGEFGVFVYRDGLSIALRNWLSKAPDIVTSSVALHEAVGSAVKDLRRLLEPRFTRPELITRLRRCDELLAQDPPDTGSSTRR